MTETEFLNLLRVCSTFDIEDTLSITGFEKDVDIIKFLQILESRKLISVNWDCGDVSLTPLIVACNNIDPKTVPKAKRKQQPKEKKEQVHYHIARQLRELGIADNEHYIAGIVKDLLKIGATQSDILSLATYVKAVKQARSRDGIPENVYGKNILPTVYEWWVSKGKPTTVVPKQNVSYDLE